MTRGVVYGGAWNTTNGACENPVNECRQRDPNQVAVLTCADRGEILRLYSVLKRRVNDKECVGCGRNCKRVTWVRQIEMKPFNAA